MYNIYIIFAMLLILNTLDFILLYPFHMFSLLSKCYVVWLLEKHVYLANLMFMHEAVSDKNFNKRQCVWSGVVQFAAYTNYTHLNKYVQYAVLLYAVQINKQGF